MRWSLRKTGDGARRPNALARADTGFALARSVIERWPATKILLTSGFPDAKISDELEAMGSVRLLSKPYRKEELARALRDMLDA